MFYLLEESLRPAAFSRLANLMRVPFPEPNFSGRPFLLWFFLLSWRVFGCGSICLWFLREGNTVAGFQIFTLLFVKHLRVLGVIGRGGSLWLRLVICIRSGYWVRICCRPNIRCGCYIRCGCSGLGSFCSCCLRSNLDIFKSVNSSFNLDNSSDAQTTIQGIQGKKSSDDCNGRSIKKFLSHLSGFVFFSFCFCFWRGFA
jgi:hypothetical protein